MLNNMELQMINDIYFKMHCLYNAETELYDRSLTDMRDKYDPTSAYLVDREASNKSNIYAKKLYRWCRNQIEYETGMPFNFVSWNESIKKYIHLSAQGWIDLYEYLLLKQKINVDRRDFIKMGV